MIYKIFTSLIVSTFLVACGGGGGGGGSSVSTPPDNNGGSDPDTGGNTSSEDLSAGTATIINRTADAFSSPSANMTDVERIQDFNLGDDFFQNPWVEGSASTSSRDGLGAHFNSRACQNCHVRDGRGHAPDVSATEDGTDFSTILIKATRSAISSSDQSLMMQSLKANVPDSSVGGQLHNLSVTNVQAETTLRVTYTAVNMQFTDGFSVALRQPSWILTSEYPGFDFDSDTIFSARTAPAMIGLGLLQLIPEAEIIQQADPEDGNGDGISGKANRVWSASQSAVALGRFGWRAGQATLIDQTAAAFVNDMGLTSRLQPTENCMPHQADCLAAPNGNGSSVSSEDYEVRDLLLDAIAFYAAHLGVPQRRDAFSDQVQRGKALFNEAGCAACHRPEYTTASSTEQPELSEQVIFPYTDLLLHDMGEDLADFTIDNQPADADTPAEYLATAREWRTPPLWGLGLAQSVDPEATFLHDGRARTILEAVLWHGGEAEAAKQQVLNFNAAQREDLLAFLNDL